MVLIELGAENTCSSLLHLFISAANVIKDHLKSQSNLSNEVDICIILLISKTFLIEYYFTYYAGQVQFIVLIGM